MFQKLETYVKNLRKIAKIKVSLNIDFAKSLN